MLFEQREVVRNHHVRQIEYCLGEYISKGDTDVYSILSHYENKSLKDFYTHYARKDILKDVIRNPYEYYYLYQKYTEAKNAGDNDEFSLSYKVNPKQNLVINDKIYVYHFPSRIRIGKRKLFPWDYPDSISDVGNSYHYNDKEIIYDFIMIGYLSFYFKYRLNIMKDHLLKVTSKNS